MPIILGQGGQNDPKSLPLSTRRRTHIDNEPRPEWAPNRLKSSIQDYRTLFPRALLRSITATYNCLGMTFAARRTCIEPDLTHMILNEDGYIQLAGAEQARVGDVVVYKEHGEVAHVGVLIEIGDALRSRVLYVLSKWGSFGDYTHPIDEVPPLFGRAEEFWTDRRSEYDL